MKHLLIAVDDLQLIHWMGSVFRPKMILTSALKNRSTYYKLINHYYYAGYCDNATIMYS